MDRVAVVVHRKKTTHGGGPDALRAALAREGVLDPLWYEVGKSRTAPKHARRALKDGADLVLVWGGDGMVQRTTDALEVGVATADGVLDWARTLGRMALGRSERSPFVRITRGRKVKVQLGAPLPYELDGGAQGEVRKFTAAVDAGAITVRLPAS